MYVCIYACKYYKQTNIYKTYSMAFCSVVSTIRAVTSISETFSLQGKHFLCFPNPIFLAVAQDLHPQPTFTNSIKGHLILVADLEHSVLALAQPLQPLHPGQLLHLLIALLSTKRKAAPSPAAYIYIWKTLLRWKTSVCAYNLPDDQLCQLEK